MEDSGRVRIADFGLAQLTKNMHSLRPIPHQGGLTMRWAAPEVWREEDYSRKADVFSFAMVMIEVLLEQRAVWELGLIRAYEGILWRSSIQRPYVFRCCGYYGARRASAAADAPNSYRKNMVINQTLLGARPSLAPRGYRSLADPPHSVSPSSTLAVTCLSDCVQ